MTYGTHHTRVHRHCECVEGVNNSELELESYVELAYDLA